MAHIFRTVSNGIYNVYFFRFRLDKNQDYSKNTLFIIKEINYYLDKLAKLVVYFDFDINVRTRSIINEEYGIVSKEDKEKIEKLKKLLNKTKNFFEEIKDEINEIDRIFFKNVLNAYKIYVMQLDYQIKYFKKNAKLAIKYMEKNYLEDITEKHILCMNEKTYQELEDELEDL